MRVNYHRRRMRLYRCINQAELASLFCSLQLPFGRTDGRLVTPIGPRILPGSRADKAMFSRQPFVVDPMESHPPYDDSRNNSPSSLETLEPKVRPSRRTFSIRLNQH